MILLLKFWRESLIVLLIISLLLTTWYFKNELLSAAEQLQTSQDKVSEVKGYLKAQNMIIESNRADYEIALNKLPTVLHEIETKTKTEYNTIYAWKDSNETHDCNNSMQYLNSFQF